MIMSASREDVKITFRNILQISIGKMGSKRKGNKSATCKVNQSLRNTLWNQVSGLLMTLPVWDRTRLDGTRCDRSKGIRFKAQIVNCQSHWRHARVGRTKWGVRVEERGRERRRGRGRGTLKVKWMQMAQLNELASDARYDRKVHLLW